MHVQEPEGPLRSGGDALIAVLAALPGSGWLARLAERVGPLRGTLAWGYALVGAQPRPPLASGAGAAGGGASAGVAVRAVRGRAYLISVVLAGAVALPQVGLVQDDSFPVSTYPMFAARRTAEVTISHAVAVDVDGTRRAVSPGAVANLEVMQAFETVRQAVRQGPAATQRLCERIATRRRRTGGAAARVEIGQRALRRGGLLRGAPGAAEEAAPRELRGGGAMRRVARRLDGYWLAPAPAERLALLRILVGGFCALYLAVFGLNLVSVAGFEGSQFEPVGVVGALGSQVAAPLVYGLVVATFVAGLGFVAGWRFRLSGPAFALLLLAVTSYRSSWGQIFHTENLLVLHVLVLALSPAAAARSLDARGGRGWRRGRRRTGATAGRCV